LKSELLAILQTLPVASSPENPEMNRLLWESWRDGLTRKVTLSANLPALRLVPLLDNLIGHKNPHLYTFGGSWLNMAESIQRILKRRALDGFHPRILQQSSSV
jgi:hypothetical protein